MQILVLGSVNVDWMINVQHFPRPGETRIARGMTESFGGKGANQAVALANLGMAPQFLGHVGCDGFGDRILQDLAEKGVQVENIGRSKNQPTGRAIIYVDENGENEIVVIPGANYEASVEWLERHKPLFQDYQVLVLQLEVPLEVVEAAIKMGQEYGMFIVLNPAPVAQLDPSLYSKIDLLIPNEQEALELSGKADLLEAADYFLNHGCPRLAISRGKAGVLGVTQTERIFKPAHDVRVLDTTGAGDCFVAAITWALIQEYPFEEALEFANQVAAFSVTKSGTMASYPTLADLNN